MHINLLSLEDINLLAKEKQSMALRRTVIRKMGKINPRFKPHAFSTQRDELDRIDQVLAKINELKTKLNAVTSEVNESSVFYAEDGRQLHFEQDKNSWADGHSKLMAHQTYKLPVDDKATLLAGKLVN